MRKAGYKTVYRANSNLHMSAWKKDWKEIHEKAKSWLLCAV